MVERPKTRGECQDGPRPCPWVSCRYHLLRDHLKSIDQDPETAADYLFAMEETCALDVADRGEHTAAAVADLMALTHQRVFQLTDFRPGKSGVNLMDRRKIRAGLDGYQGPPAPEPGTYNNPAVEGWEVW